jgi:hypothetical protein
VRKLSSAAQDSIHGLKAQIKETHYQMPSPTDPLHPVADRLRKRLEHAKAGKEGIIKVAAAGLPALEIGEASKDRAVTLLNALVLEVERQGGKVESCEQGLCLRIEGELISLQMSEKRDRILHIPSEKEKAALARWEKQYQAKLKLTPYASDWDKPVIPQYDMPLSDHLLVEIDKGWHWDSLRRGFGDGKQQRLENMIPKIVIAAVTCATAKREERIKQAEEAKQREIRARQYEIAHRQQALEEKRREALAKQLENWRRAQEIRTGDDILY